MWNTGGLLVVHFILGTFELQNNIFLKILNTLNFNRFWQRHNVIQLQLHIIGNRLTSEKLPMLYLFQISSPLPSQYGMLIFVCLYFASSRVVCNWNHITHTFFTMTSLLLSNVHLIFINVFDDSSHFYCWKKIQLYGYHTDFLRSIYLLEDIMPLSFLGNCE